MKFTIYEELSTFNFGKEFTEAGRSYDKKISEKDVDEKELEKGIEVEMEHTTNKDIAKKIALDHLAELKDYYTRLKKMEEEGKKDGAEVKGEKDEDKDKDSDSETEDDASEKNDKEDKESEKSGSSMKV